MSASNKVRIIGEKANVVSTDHLSIDEVVGNVATQCDDLSVAIVTIAEPTSEPWITIHYDEYMHVIDGKSKYISKRRMDQSQ